MILKWLFGKKKEKPMAPTVINFGRYLHKPVMERAVSYITGLDFSTFTSLVANRKLLVNGQALLENRLLERLESGSYEIIRLDTETRWLFFIA